MVDVRVLMTYDAVLHGRRRRVVVTSASGGTAAVDWIRLVRAGVFTGHTAVAVMVSREH